MLADCYLQTGQDKEVVALLKPREQMFGNDLAYAYLLGTALLHLDDAVEGQKYVDRVFGAGESAEAHLLLGIAHLGAAGLSRGAKTELERAVKLNPKLPTAHSLYGRSLLALGEQEAAERAFRKELELNINDFEANLQLGNMRKAAQKFDEASTYLERATTIRPDDIAGAQAARQACACRPAGRRKPCRCSKRSSRRRPNLVEVHVQLATAYNRLKRKDDARARARDHRSAERRSAGEAARRRSRAGAAAVDSRCARAVSVALAVDRVPCCAVCAAAQRRPPMPRPRRQTPQGRRLPPPPAFDG